MTRRVPVDESECAPRDGRWPDGATRRGILAVCGVLLGTVLLASCAGGGGASSLSPTRSIDATRSVDVPAPSPSVVLPTASRSVDVPEPTATLPTRTPEPSVVPSIAPPSPAPTETTRPTSTPTPSPSAAPPPSSAPPVTPPPAATTPSPPAQTPTAIPTTVTPPPAQAATEPTSGGTSGWTWWLVALVLLAAAAAVLLIVRSRRRRAWDAQLEECQQDVAWFARELMPQLRQAGSTEQVIGGWRVGGRERVTAVEDRLTALASSAPDQSCTDRATALRDAVRESSQDLDAIAPEGGDTSTVAALDRVTIRLEQALPPPPPPPPQPAPGAASES